MGFFSDVFDIVAAPVKVVTAVAGAVTKPIAEVVNELAEDIKDALK